MVIVLIFFMSYSATAKQNTFDDDLALLNQHFSPIVLDQQGRRISVLPELQGRIMHATTSKVNSASIGWLNRRYLKNKTIQLTAAIGGADRLWFGPDGGYYSVFLEPGANTEPENIRPLKALTFDSFQVVSKSASSASFKHRFAFRNHLGFEFDASVIRTVSVFNQQKVESDLGITISDTIEWVAYGSENTVTNSSDVAWRSEKGVFSLWILGMFEPGAIVVIPLRKPLKKATNYFTPPSDQKVRIINSTLLYNADAKLMNKVGVPPEHTMPILGSYDQRRQRLTIIKFSFDPSQTNYVNAVWDWQAPPLEGEAINIFNDGPQADGKPFGPFYEMETSSRALELEPKESETHIHNTYHFIGKPDQLDSIARQLLGIRLAQIKLGFSTPSP